jgi:hypothetical protein
VEINPQGKPVDTILDISSPHDPEMQNNGNILVANQEQSAHSAFDYNPTTNQNDWQYDMITERSEMPMRDVNLLPNGNILITGATKIVEVTRDKEVVWQLELTEAPGISQTSSDGFYKAERLSN